MGEFAGFPCRFPVRCAHPELHSGLPFSFGELDLSVTCQIAFLFVYFVLFVVAPACVGSGFSLARRAATQITPLRKGLVGWFCFVCFRWDLLLPAAIPDFIREHPFPGKWFFDHCWRANSATHRDSRERELTLNQRGEG